MEFRSRQNNWISETRDSLTILPAKKKIIINQLRRDWPQIERRVDQCCPKWRFNSSCHDFIMSCYLILQCPYVLSSRPLCPYVPKSYRSLSPFPRLKPSSLNVPCQAKLLATLVMTCTMATSPLSRMLTAVRLSRHDSPTFDATACRSDHFYPLW